MSLIKKNIFANFAGTIWQALMAIVFVPLYVEFMGIESYGLVGIFATLQAIFSLLDAGLGNTLNRELARLSVLPERVGEMRNLVRTLEVVYWFIAIFIGVTIGVLAPFIARHWVNAGNLPTETVEHAILLMGLVLMFQMPSGFYSGGLMGLQEQVLLNAINVIVGTLRGFGVILVLWLISPTIQAFFLWQFLIGFINAVLVAVCVWKKIPAGPAAAFKMGLLRGVWRFATGMGSISVLAVVLMQLDKIILSRLLSLEMFGYYMLASTVAMGLSRIYTPVFYSMFPRFTQLAAADNLVELKRLFHRSCQLMSVLVLPAASVIAFFSHDLLLIWTRNPVTAEKTHLILSFMVFGSALNGLMNLPYALQLAFGWLKLPIVVNMVSVIVFVPMVIMLVGRYGALGGAVAWLILNLGYIIFWIPAIHSKLLVEEKWRWYFLDSGLPLITCISVAGFFRMLAMESVSLYLMIAQFTVVLFATLAITALATPVTREWLATMPWKNPSTVSQ